MNRHRPAAWRSAAFAGAALFLFTSLPAQTLEWIGVGGTGNWNTGTNWDPNTSLNTGTTWDLVIQSTGDNAALTSMIPGASFTIRSLSMDNTSQLLNNTAGVIRFVATTASNSTVARTVTFGTADVSIITLTNNVNMNVNSSTLATNPGTPSMTLNLGYTGNGTVHIDGTSQLTVSGPNATITGTGGIIKTGEGDLRLSGNHTYAGGFTLEEGTVTITTSGGNSSSAVTSSPFGTGTLVLRGGVIDSSSANGRTVRNHTLLDGDVTISTGGSNSGNVTWSAGAGQSTTIVSDSTLNITQTVNWSQAIGGTGNLTKDGSGTLRLDAVNTFAGTTHVNAGTLVLAAGSSLAGGLNVASAATVTGTGTVNGAATIAGAHNPGNSPGIQTFNDNLTYTTGASVTWELNGNTSTQGSPTAIFDQIVVGGTLDFAGATLLQLTFNAAGSTVNWNDAFWSTNQSWLIYDAAAVSNFGNLSLDISNWADGSGNLFNTILAGSSFGMSVGAEGVYLNYAAIPEPSTYAALFGAAVLGFVIYRRRRSA